LIIKKKRIITVREYQFFESIIIPWIKGQPLVWDVTVVDTLADSYVSKTSEVSGFAAEMACKRKHSKFFRQTTYLKV
jgi:hypothetical protein